MEQPEEKKGSSYTCKCGTIITLENGKTFEVDKNGSFSEPEEKKKLEGVQTVRVGLSETDAKTGYFEKEPEEKESCENEIRGTYTTPVCFEMVCKVFLAWITNKNICMTDVLIVKELKKDGQR